MPPAKPGALLGASEIKAVSSTSSGHGEAFAFAPVDQVDLIDEARAVRQVA
jgi:hypothetical protein